MYVLVSSFCLQSPSKKPPTAVSGGSAPLGPGGTSSMQSPESEQRREEETERQRLTSELHEIERERLGVTYKHKIIMISYNVVVG